MGLMDELAARGITSEDLEKAASARLFEQAAAAEGIDLNTLNDAQIDDLYSVWANGAAKAPAAEEAKTASAGEIEEAQAKLAEAEILGRHMARMYVDELNKEAEAGKRRSLIGSPAAGTVAAKDPGAGSSAAKATADKAVKAVEDERGSIKGRVKKFLGMEGKKRRSILSADKSLPYKRQAELAVGKGVEYAKSHPGRVGGAVAGAAALTAGAGLAAHRLSKGKGEAKEASAFDELAAARALDILEANGLTVDDNGEVMKAADAPAEDDVTIDQAVDAGAWELLSELGFSQAE